MSLHSIEDLRLQRYKKISNKKPFSPFSEKKFENGAIILTLFNYFLQYF